MPEPSTGSPTLERREDHLLARFVAMAGPCEVLVDSDDQADAATALEVARAEALRIERKFSRYRDDNIVHQIQHAGGRPVTVENAQTFTTFHPRCGTSFLMVVMVVSMAVYTLIPFDGFALKFLSRVALLPVIAGLSYELIRFAAKRRGSILATLTAPGLWLQRITTKPPSDDQTAVAICALEHAMALEKEQGGELVIA